jgi:transcriptional regulator with XRE-family HTH domain
VQDSEVLIKIGINIKKAREELGLSQTQLANDMGKDQQWLQRIEKGKVNVTIKSLNLITKTLKIQIKNLIEF